MRVGLSLFPVLADALLLPIFIGDRLGETGSLFLRGPIFNFETRVDAKNSISDKNNAYYAANGYFDARAGDASHINLFLAHDAIC